MFAPIKPVVLVRDGETMLKPMTTAAKKQADVVLTTFECKLQKGAIHVTARRSKLFGSEKYDCSFPLEGSTFEKVEEGRSAGKAAAGAVAGAVLLGPLGMLAGAALGGGKKHTYAVAYRDDTVVVEFNKATVAQLIAKGVIESGE